MSVLLIRNTWVLGSNVTTIEGWEIDRHEILVRRAKKRGGYLDGPDGTRVMITKQEFPYDIGLYQNARQAMGCSFFLWLWPLTYSPSNRSGLDFATNGFEEPGTSWPPPDPDRMPRRSYEVAGQDPFTFDRDSSQIDVQAFRRRQQKDALRFTNGRGLYSSTLLQQRSRTNTKERTDESQESGDDEDDTGSGPRWRDREGDRLHDFGVDEEAEGYEEDGMPLAEMVRRRKAGKEGTKSH
ncbi:MAG: hypothetical protein Q9174_006852 [Haloplaca sp. 1 TL-2023]